jgi:hypothetical protein
MSHRRRAQRNLYLDTKPKMRLYLLITPTTNTPVTDCLSPSENAPPMSEGAAKAQDGFFAKYGPI